MNRLIVNGEYLSDYCRRTGIKYNAVWNNISLGLSVENAIEKTRVLKEHKERRKKLVDEIKAKNPDITDVSISQRIRGIVPKDTPYKKKGKYGRIKYRINGVSLKNLTDGLQYQWITKHYRNGDDTLENLYTRTTIFSDDKKDKLSYKKRFAGVRNGQK